MNLPAETLGYKASEDSGQITGHARSAHYSHDPVKFFIITGVLRKRRDCTQHTRGSKGSAVRKSFSSW